MAKKNGLDTFEKQIKKTVPILTLDNRWHMLFPEEKKTSTIKKLEENVNALLKKQGKLIQDAKALKKLKRDFMQKIVSNMEESTSKKKEEARIKQLENSQRYIKEINDKLLVYDDQLEAIPRAIREANEELLKASFEICYEDLKKNKKQIAELEEWINKTKEILKEKIVMKQDLEDNSSAIYSYMHDILGAELMEDYDQKHL